MRARVRFSCKRKTFVASDLGPKTAMENSMCFDMPIIITMVIVMIRVLFFSLRRRAGISGHPEPRQNKTTVLSQATTVHVTILCGLIGTIGATTYTSAECYTITLTLLLVRSTHAPARPRTTRNDVEPQAVATPEQIPLRRCRWSQASRCRNRANRLETECVAPIIATDSQTGQV